MLISLSQNLFHFVKFEFYCLQSRWICCGCSSACERGGLYVLIYHRPGRIPLWLCNLRVDALLAQFGGKPLF